MSYAAHLWLFFVLVFGAVILPGQDMAFILSCALTGGRRHGLAAVAGAITGAACHSVFAAAGVGLLLTTWPWAFNILLLAGAAFIGWIGLGVLRGATHDETAAAAANGSPWRSWRRETANNLLNPNAYLFSLAIFPQFIVPDRGAVALQAAALFLIIGATQILVYGTVVLAAAQTQRWLAGNARAQRHVRLAVGLMLLGVALLTGIAGWQRL